MKANKTEIMGLLRDFVGRRPGLEFVNYGDVRAYRAESARIVRDRRDFMELFSFVVWNGGVELDDLVDGFRAFSGRLSLVEREGRPALEYTTGQYFPTEYRRAACAVLARAVRNYWLRNMTEIPGKRITTRYGSQFEAYDFEGKPVTLGDWLRRKARRTFSRGVAEGYLS